jgi:glycerate 2-kinase
MSVRSGLVDFFLAGVDAVAPGPLVDAWLSAHPIETATVIAAGKAAAGMAEAALQRIDVPACLVVALRPVELPAPARVVVGGHPVPDDGSFSAGRAAAALAGGLGADDRLLVLLSGGASALLEAPLPGVSNDDVVAATEMLLRSGAPIEDVNAIRASISALKAGGLADLAAPAAVTTLAISDVPGSEPATIGSGPTVAGRVVAAMSVIERLGLESVLPPSVIAAARRTRHGAVSGEFQVLADGRTAARAAAVAAVEAGRSARVADAPLRGEAAATAVDIVRSARRGVTVHWGETTVQADRFGEGGRNLEAALAAAVALDGRGGVTFLAAGTDGIDGSSQAAGAVVDGQTAAAMRTSGADPAGILASHDSGVAHRAAGTAIVTGDTGTNVGDIWIVARE